MLFDDRLHDFDEAGGCCAIAWGLRGPWRGSCALCGGVLLRFNLLDVGFVANLEDFLGDFALLSFVGVDLVDDLSPLVV